MLTGFQCWLLRKLSPQGPNCCTGAVYNGKSKLEILLGPQFLERTAGKDVIDFGCGEGAEAIEMAVRGARRVIGLDIREDVLETARQRALVAGVENVCYFVHSTNERTDIIVSIDAFEHFSEPARILTVMNELLRPGGEALVSFGPTWYHPLGGHLFSVFPWAHLIFSEKALMKWRSSFKTDGATRISEVAGGLNQMTIKRFEELIKTSRFEIVSLETIPIRRLRLVHNRATREFTTAIVRYRLVKED